MVIVINGDIPIKEHLLQTLLSAPLFVDLSIPLLSSVSKRQDVFVFHHTDEAIGFLLTPKVWRGVALAFGHVYKEFLDSKDQDSLLIEHEHNTNSSSFWWGDPDRRIHDQIFGLEKE